jgi:enterochelin esterase-like enzyme
MLKRANMAFLIMAILLPLGDCPSESNAQEKPKNRGMDNLSWVTRSVRAPHVQYRSFDSTAAQTKVSYHIYMPKTYDTQEKRRFPVLYWLHGSGGGLEGIPYVSRFFDAAIRQEKMPPVLVVFPNGMADSMWCDSKDGKVPMETVVIRELIPHIDKTYRTLASRKGRMVEGFSMGGYGAARFGFKYPGLFCAVSILGAGPMQRVFSEDIGPRYKAGDRGRVLRSVYGGDQEYFKAQSPWVWAEEKKDILQKDSLTRIAIGGLDAILPYNRDFHEHLEDLGIPHSFSVMPHVKHNVIGVLTRLGEENWVFYRTAFGRLAATGSGKTRLLAVGKAKAADPPKLQERALTAVSRVAGAARKFKPAIIVHALAENVMTKKQVRQGEAREKVTGEIFSERMRQLAKLALSQDTVVIYTHSHGRRAGFEGSQSLGGLVMDLPVRRPEHRGTLLWDEYVEMLLKIPAKNVLVLTMSCFSGGLVEYLNRPNVRNRWKDRQQQGRNFIVLSSQNKDLPSPAIVIAGEVINPFTYAVAKALGGEADGFLLRSGKPAESRCKDGKLTVGEIIDYILYTTENTASEFAGRKNNAKPQLTGSFDRKDVLIIGGDFNTTEEGQSPR